MILMLKVAFVKGMRRNAPSLCNSGVCLVAATAAMCLAPASVRLANSLLPSRARSGSIRRSSPPKFLSARAPGGRIADDLLIKILSQIYKTHTHARMLRPDIFPQTLLSFFQTILPRTQKLRKKISYFAVSNSKLRHFNLVIFVAIYSCLLCRFFGELLQVLYLYSQFNNHNSRPHRVHRTGSTPPRRRVRTPATNF